MVDSKKKYKTGNKKKNYPALRVVKSSIDVGG